MTSEKRSFEALHILYDVKDTTPNRSGACAGEFFKPEVNKMSIFEQILYWIDKDSMDFILTVFFSLIFFDGILPAWIDKIKDQGDEYQDDVM